MDDLPEDVVTSILLRLPMQELIRCRCVSKKWCVLIKSSAFIHTHMALQRAIGYQLVVYSRYDNVRHEHTVSCYKYECDPLSFLRTQPDVYVQVSDHVVFSGDCNGLICFSTFLTDTLMNPALRQLKTLPPGPLPSGLGVDRSNMLDIGFGYDDVKKDYKVVRLYGVLNELNCPWEAFIYELRTNSWRKLSETPACKPISNVEICAPHIKLLYPSPVFYKGFVHWSILKKIVTFNMTRELFDEMELPRSSEDCGSNLFVLGSSTFACVSHLYLKLEVMNVWVMKEYGVSDSWTKLYTIQQTGLLRPLCFWKDDHKLLCKGQEELICYHLPTLQIHRIHQLDHRSNFFDAFEFRVCYQSLVSINQTVEDAGDSSSESGR